MPRKLLPLLALLAVVVLATPAVAVPRVAGTGSVFGKLSDSVPGAPFDFTDGSLLAVDVFNLTTMERTVQWLSGTAPSGYDFPSLVVGSYKMRFRYWDHKGNLTRYRWYGNTGNFDAATPLTVLPGAALRIDFTLRPTPGAAVSGTVAERGSGLPLGKCHMVELFEASGISLGLLADPDSSGAWSLPMVPVGRYAVLGWVQSSALVSGCEAPPSHLDTWRGGASGHPLHHANLVADAHTFATARIFRVRDGVDVTGLKIPMPLAPLCRGRVPTIFGTTLDDVILGTAGRDIIAGLAGNDEIRGLRGNDLMCGNGGDDLLIGGAGPKDLADGGLGTDTCDAERTIGCP